MGIDVCAGSVMPKEYDAKERKWWCRTRASGPALRRPGFGSQPCGMGDRRIARRPEEVKQAIHCRRLLAAWMGGFLLALPAYPF